MIDKTRLKLLLTTAETMGLNPKLISNQGLVAINVNGKERYLFHKASNPNNHAASRLAENKYVARLIFERNRLPNTPFLVATNLSEARKFLCENKKIIAKPIKGEKSQSVYLINTEKQLEKIKLDEYILEKFISGQEVRILVVNGKAKAYHYKMYEGEINDPKTVQRVSIAKENWDQKLIDLGIDAARAVGLIFAAVDFLVTTDNKTYMLEINSAPGIERFQKPDQGPPVDIMRMYLEVVVGNYKGERLSL